MPGFPAFADEVNDVGQERSKYRAILLDAPLGPSLLDGLVWDMIGPWRTATTSLAGKLSPMALSTALSNSTFPVLKDSKKVCFKERSVWSGTLL